MATNEPALEVTGVRPLVFRVISGAIGLSLLLGVAVLVPKLLAMELDARTLLAGYMGIGAVLVGAFLSYYAIAGKW